MSDDEAQPCQCHDNHAMIAPFHHGHCCFWPVTSTCHPDELAAWTREHDRYWGREPRDG